VEVALLQALTWQRAPGLWVLVYIPPHLSKAVQYLCVIGSCFWRRLRTVGLPSLVVRCRGAAGEPLDGRPKRMEAHLCECREGTVHRSGGWCSVDLFRGSRLLVR